MRFKLGFTLTIIGALLVIVPAIIALQMFYTYALPALSTTTIEESILALIYLLAEIAIRLGFLGITVWAGSILLKHGLSILFTRSTPKQSKEPSEG